MRYTQAILTALAEPHPKIVVEMRNLDVVEQATALVHGEVDAAFHSDAGCRPGPRPRAPRTRPTAWPTS